MRNLRVGTWFLSSSSRVRRDKAIVIKVNTSIANRHTIINSLKTPNGYEVFDSRYSPGLGGLRCMAVLKYRVVAESVGG